MIPYCTGGTALDKVLADHFADKFDEEHKKKIRDFPKVSAVVG